MRVDYYMKEEDYKITFEKSLKRSCIFFFFFFALIFGLVEFLIFKEALLLGVIYYGIGMICFSIFLLLFLKFYVFITMKTQKKRLKDLYGKIVCEVTDEGISEKFPKECYSLKWKELQKITLTPTLILAIPRKNKLPILLRKENFEEKEQFEALKEKMRICSSIVK